MSTRYRHPLARHAAGTILGYRRDGRPIYVIAGGSTPPEPTPTDPPSPAPAPEPTPAPQPQNDDPAATIARLESDLAAARKEAAKSRTVAKENAAAEARNALAQDIGRALGLVQDDTPPDPAQLTQQLTEVQQQARQAAVELAVYRNAAAAGGDPTALLDSRTFAASLDGIDPTDAAAVQAAIAAAVTANPKLAVAPRAGRSGGDMGGAGGSGDQAHTLDKQIAQAKANGDWRAVMRLENSKLAAVEAQQQ